MTAEKRQREWLIRLIVECDDEDIAFTGCMKDALPCDRCIVNTLESHKGYKVKAIWQVRSGLY